MSAIGLLMLLQWFSVNFHSLLKLFYFANHIQGNIINNQWTGLCSGCVTLTGWCWYWQMYHVTAMVPGLPCYCTLSWLSYSSPAHLLQWAGPRLTWAEPMNFQAAVQTGMWRHTRFSFTVQASMLTSFWRLIGRQKMLTPPTHDMTHCMTSLASRPITQTDIGN